MSKILVVNGPNLGLLGKRETEVYGEVTLAGIESGLKEEADKLGIELVFVQSDSEGEIVDAIGKAWASDEAAVDGIIINPGGYTHTSVAIHDAIKASSKPVIEVHISPIYKREEFRHKSVISSACIGQIIGFGKDSYILGLWAMDRYLGKDL